MQARSSCNDDEDDCAIWNKGVTWISRSGKFLMIAKVNDKPVAQSGVSRQCTSTVFKQSDLIRLIDYLVARSKCRLASFRALWIFHTNREVKQHDERSEHLIPVSHFPIVLNAENIVLCSCWGGVVSGRFSCKSVTRTVLIVENRHSISNETGRKHLSLFCPIYHRRWRVTDTPGLSHKLITQSVALRSPGLNPSAPFVKTTGSYFRVALFGHPSAQPKFYSLTRAHSLKS